MPCNSVVELIQIIIDSRDRLKDYQFIKKTCGQGVGANSLLIDYFRGMTVADLLAVDSESFCRAIPASDEIIEFLNLKHLFAVQAALEVLTGSASGGRGHPCAVAEVSYDDGELVIDAEIDVEVITEKIRACSACKGG